MDGEAKLLTTKDLKEELEFLFSDYFSDINIEEVESYFDNPKAWEIKMLPNFRKIPFELYIEQIEDEFKFEQGEDHWESLVGGEIFKFLFFEVLSRMSELEENTKRTSA